MKITQIIAATILLSSLAFSASISMANNSKSDGGSETGGGSSKDNQSFDTWVRKNRVKVSESSEIYKRYLKPNLTELEKISPLLAEKIALTIRTKSFVPAKEIPNQEKGLKHYMADKLVAVQELNRPIVWIDEAFVKNATLEDLADLLLHEGVVDTALTSHVNLKDKKKIDAILNLSVAIADLRESDGKLTKNEFNTLLAHADLDQFDFSKQEISLRAKIIDEEFTEVLNDLSKICGRGHDTYVDAIILMENRLLGSLVKNRNEPKDAQYVMFSYAQAITPMIKASSTSYYKAEDRFAWGALSSDDAGQYKAMCSTVEKQQALLVETKKSFLKKNLNEALRKQLLGVTNHVREICWNANPKNNLEKHPAIHFVEQIDSLLLGVALKNRQLLPKENFSSFLFYINLINPRIHETQGYLQSAQSAWGYPLAENPTAQLNILCDQSQVDYALRKDTHSNTEPEMASPANSSTAE